MSTRLELLQRNAFHKVSLVFGLAYILALFIQFTDYIKSYVLYIQAKKTLITMYKKDASVEDMQSQADIVDYLSGLSVSAIQQIFYITATFAFVAAIVLIVIHLGKKA